MSLIGRIDDYWHHIKSVHETGKAEDRRMERIDVLCVALSVQDLIQTNSVLFYILCLSSCSLHSGHKLLELQQHHFFHP